MTADPPNDAAKRGRGRPRREGAAEEILAVARELLAERGYRDFSLDLLVERTGIAKTTIYRRWPSKGALAAAAIAPAPADLPDSRAVLEELTAVLRLLSNPDGDALEVIRAVVAPRRETLVQRLSHEGHPAAEREADLLVGALLTRLIVTREPLL